MFQSRKHSAMAVAAGLVAAGMSSGSARAAIQINEIFFDVPNSSTADYTGRNNGRAYFELKGTPGESVEGLTMLTIEGDGAAAGVIDRAIPLTGLIGTNGLCLRPDDAIDSAGTEPIAYPELQPPPEPGTTVIIEDYGTENPSYTWALVSGFSGTTTTDLDTDNDGTLDATPWTSVIDAFGFKDAVTDILYANHLTGGVDFDEAVLPGTATDRLHAFFRDTSGTPFAGTVTYSTDAPAGPYTFTALMGADGAIATPDGLTLTPGSSNPAVPEPASLSLLAAGGLALLRRRRRPTSDCRSHA